MRGPDARVAAVIRIDSLWLAVEPVDMRAGAERLLASVVHVFGSAQAHHGYLFANARTTRIGNPPENPKAAEVEFSKKEDLREEIKIYGQPNHGCFEAC